MQKNRVVDLLKTISMFDIQSDFNDSSREKLSLLFREIINSRDPKAKEFLGKFLKGTHTIIKDMGIAIKGNSPDTDSADAISGANDDGSIDLGREANPTPSDMKQGNKKSADAVDNSMMMDSYISRIAEQWV